MILDSLHEAGHEIAHIGVGEPDPSQIETFKQLPYPEYRIDKQLDPFGKQKLMHMIATINFDILFIVADIWRLSDIWPQVKQIQQVKNFKIVYYFPVDQPLRVDWLPVLKDCDYPITYSMYGYHEARRCGLDNIRYMRPPVSNAYFPIKQEEKMQLRANWFRDQNVILIGWVGQNQIRKDPRRFLKIASIVHKMRQQTRFYLHTEIYSPQNGGDLKVTMNDYGIANKDIILSKNEGVVASESDMNKLYNMMDIYVNNALGEGLSYTILEAQLAGTCVAASDNTSMSELISGDKGIQIKCGTNASEMTYLPIEINGRLVYVERPSVSVDDAVDKIIDLIDNAEKRKAIAKKGYASAIEFRSKSADWNSFLKHVMVADREVVGVEI